MRVLQIFPILAALALCTLARAADNPKLAALVTADQAVRQKTPGADEWPEISKQDAARRAEVLQILRAGNVRTAKDYYNASLVMQHGDAIEEIRLANSLATISANIDPTDHHAKWLIAASWDRLLLNMKRPQWYAMQFVSRDDGKWALYDLDESAVTDEDRKALFVPTLAQAKKQVEEMNATK